MSGARVDPGERAFGSAESLNLGCTARSLDPDLLRRQLDADGAFADLYGEVVGVPGLLSNNAVFISAEQLRRVREIVAAVESVVALPAYQEEAIGRAPAIARIDHGPAGAFMGFDFHLGSQGPQLIEINTNAGGAMINAVLALAQQACCREVEWAFRAPVDLAQLEMVFVTMFADEWRRQRGDSPMGRVAIVDDKPSSQHLYPEFRLFERLFRRFGVEATVADAAELQWRDNALWHADRRIDLVYNRLTDFYLAMPGHAALNAAYRAGAAVVTPHPRAHALYADKRNLVTLSDAGRMTALGVPAPTQAVLLAGIPATRQVVAEDAAALWADRRNYFFKPAAGYGSRAAYRGDKLTRRVWEEILGGDYVAQTVVRPSQRRLDVDGQKTDLKLDVRAYAYRGAIQLLAARLYAGQTTNFRTPGGGFAPVFVASAEH